MAAQEKSMPEDDASGGPLRVLVVDDSVMIRKVLSAVLGSRGAEVTVAESAEDVLDGFEPSALDVMLVDIAMPGLSGIDLLRAVRALDADLPVLIMTGNPSVDTAAAAVEHNATRYLAKPLEPDVLWAAVTSAGQLRRLAQIRRDLQNEAQMHSPEIDRRTLTEQFEDALSKVVVHFQPIVNLGSGTTVAFEVLCRSTSEHIPYPDQLFGAAERLGRVIELGRVIRRQAGSRIGELPTSALMFVNLHPLELSDTELLTTEGGLLSHSPRVVLEVTERETLSSIENVSGRIAALKAAGFRIAVDDLGAGYAGLTSFVQLDPDIVKVDMSLVRDVHLSSQKQRLIRSFVALCSEMGTLVVVEGVECQEERDALWRAGCRWMQGYFFGRPAKDPTTWSAK